MEERQWEVVQVESASGARCYDAYQLWFGEEYYGIFATATAAWEESRALDAKARAKKP